LYFAAASAAASGQKWITRRYSPVLNFLQCPTPQAWIDKARDPANLPLLLTDHMVCELKAAQTALLLVRKYVADESGADALLDWLKPYEVFTFRDGPEPDFIALHKQIGKSVMPKTDDPWGQLLIDSMVLLIKEELHHFWQVREAMLARDIPYVKITASRYAKGMLKEVRTHEPLTLIDKLICGAYIEARSCEALCRTGAVPRRRFAEVLPVAAALGSTPLSGLSDACPAGERQRYLTRVQLFGEIEATLISTPDNEFRFHSGVPV
jgi:tRNA-(ms[2]io[6]A)-hydroxylase